MFFATMVNFKNKCIAMKSILIVITTSALLLFSNAAMASSKPDEVLQAWYKVVLELVRHTPTYTPPVASRAFAYLGVTAYEVEAANSSNLQSLAGQLHELKALPKRQAGKPYDEAIIMEAAMATAVQDLFSNTGPTGQHVMASVAAKRQAETSKGVAPAIRKRSQAYGQAIAHHILNWSQSDGGAKIENMGFPMAYELTKGPAHWVPTNAVRLQQLPLLPNWGKNRTFALASNATCPLPAPPDYSEDKNSEFYKQALEVYTIKQNLTPEQRTIAKFWSDDAMLSVTPPGHWVSIAWQIFERDHVPLDKQVDVLARLGVAEADAFIGCWNAKYQYDLLRPLTYIKRVIDPKWEALLNTPPFPEYPSGHSTQSGAAAAVLTSAFGDNFAFEDKTGNPDGLAPRKFASFTAAAEEAGISRLYGGIHYRAAIERGLEQGRCIGAAAIALKTKR
jgi:PAP2 superfamily